MRFYIHPPSVAILYIITMILGLSAVMVVGQGAYTAIIIVATFLLFAFFGGKTIMEHVIAENKSAKAEVVSDDDNEDNEGE